MKNKSELKDSKDETPVAAKVKMVRPEDNSDSPVVAEVKPEDVAHWQKQGWAVKE